MKAPVHRAGVLLAAALCTVPLLAPPAHDAPGASPATAARARPAEPAAVGPLAGGGTSLAEGAPVQSSSSSRSWST